MKYTVVWKDVAEIELGILYLSAGPDREAISNAANQIDRVLAQDPEELGESRPRGQRIYFQSPLGILFKVFPDDRIVEVGFVWRYET